MTKKTFFRKATSFRENASIFIETKQKVSWYQVPSYKFVTKWNMQL